MVYSETLDFKFLLKPKHSDAHCFVEEGPSRLLIGGALGEDARLALFRLDSGEILEYQVFAKADRVSPFDLAASWRAYQENFRPSAARWIPDVSINPAPQTGGEVRPNFQSPFCSFFTLERYCNDILKFLSSFNEGVSSVTDFILCNLFEMQSFLFCETVIVNFFECNPYTTSVPIYNTLSVKSREI